jgi:hypothetical protein
MSDFLNPNIMIISGVIGVLLLLWVIQLSIDDDTLVWLIWVPMVFIALYLLWVGGSWLVARFM